jgi:uncharacterized membrane protein YphA (DoxX/SURF4 family)
MITNIYNGTIAFSQNWYVFMARLAMAVIYIWFGFLKVIDMSPASPLVQQLFERTMPIMEFSLFLVLFGLFECLIGLLFLVPGGEKFALPLFAFHMVTTFMPIFLVSGIWSGWFVPNLEGQYIIKNLALIACALAIASNMKPLAPQPTN